MAPLARALYDHDERCSSPLLSPVPCPHRIARSVEYAVRIPYTVPTTTPLPPGCPHSRSRQSASLVLRAQASPRAVWRVLLLARAAINTHPSTAPPKHDLRNTTPAAYPPSPPIHIHTHTLDDIPENHFLTTTPTSAIARFARFRQIARAHAASSISRRLHSALSLLRPLVNTRLLDSLSPASNNNKLPTQTVSA